MATRSSKSPRFTTGWGKTGETLLARHQTGSSPVYVTPLRFDDDAAMQRPATDDAVARALTGAAERIDVTEDYRGESVLAVTGFLDSAGLAIVVKMDRAEAFAPIHKLRLFSLAALAAAAAATLLLSAPIAQSVTRPLRNLAQSARDIAGGAHAERAEVATRDEVGALAEDFNLMAERLTDANHTLERKVADRTAELERSNRDLAQFAYIASHDLKEPLRMVSSYVQLLEKRYSDKLDDDARQFIGFATDGADRMRKLISDLLMFSRVGTRGRALAPTPLQDVLQTVCKNLEIAIGERDASVTAEGELPIVNGDATQLVQLLQNLVANAIKFCREGAPQIRIEATTQDDKPDRWVIAVHDNGIGIDPEHAGRIFEVFQRLHSREHYEGTGIGLAVCRRIVERHGGTIWVEPGVERGSHLSLRPATGGSGVRSAHFVRVQGGRGSKRNPSACAALGAIA